MVRPLKQGNDKMTMDAKKIHADHDGSCFRHPESVPVDNFAALRLEEKNSHTEELVRDPPLIESRNQRNSVDEDRNEQLCLPDIQWSEYGNTELHEHVLEGDLKLVEITARTMPKLIDWRNDYGQTPLHIAVEMNNYKLVNSLLSSGANRFISDYMGNTPLHLACRNKACDTIIPSLLLDCKDHKEYDTLPNFNGEYSQHVAVKANNMDCLEILITMGLNINCQERSGGKTLLHYAVEKRNVDLLRFIVTHGDFVNIPDYTGNTPVEIAYMYFGDMWNILVELEPELMQAHYESEEEMSTDDE